MDKSRHSERIGNEIYSKLTYDDDFSTEDQTGYDNKDQQKVVMSLRPGSGWRQDRLIVVGLGLLGVILLSADIGLGVYYNIQRQAEPPLNTMARISEEIIKLKASIAAVVKTRDETKKELAKEVSSQAEMNWQIVHQKSLGGTYKRKIDDLYSEISGIESQLPLHQESCRHCMPGFQLLNSVCYYFAFSNTLPRKTWRDARNNCISKKADLVVIDTMEEQLTISRLLNENDKQDISIYSSGFWMGLTDVAVEGEWKWLNGTRLTHKYWNSGEPNDSGRNEDCAATYPRKSPLTAWNDAPCDHPLKWICEAPRF